MAHTMFFILAVVGVAHADYLGADYGLASSAYSTQTIQLAPAPITIAQPVVATKYYAPPATSSQSIKRIYTTGYAAAAPAYSYAATSAPTYSYAAPAYSYAAAPAYSYAAAAPAYSYAARPAPAYSYAAPAYSYAAAPAYSYAAGAPAYSYADPTYAAIKAEPVDLHPQYKYSYGVQDPKTGDVKSASETRDGDVVKGQYSLIDSDGTRRVVDYAADSHNGFNAVVRKEPLYQKVAYAAPVAVAAPLITKTVSLGGYGYDGLYGYGKL